LSTKNGPACAGPKVIGVEPYAYSYARRYSLRAYGPDPPELRGAGGLRIPALDGRPGPEATVFWVAFQLGTRLSAIGQHYESINEFVMAAVTVSHLRGGAGALRDLVVLDQDTSESMNPKFAHEPAATVVATFGFKTGRYFGTLNFSLLPTHASGAIIVVTELSWKEAPHELRRY
jgi:hypothetical protein